MHGDNGISYTTIIQLASQSSIDIEIGNLINKTCFFIKDIGQYGMMMILLFSFNADQSMKAHLVVDGKMCKWITTSMRPIA